MYQRAHFDQGLNRRGIRFGWLALFILVSLFGIALQQLLG